MTDVPRPRRRRIWLPIGLATALAVAGGLVLPNIANAATTLKQLATAKGITFAAAVANNHLSEAQYTSTLDTEFSGLTPENEMKWDTTEPNRNSFNFGPADAIVAHAQAQGMKIRGHTLVWHSQLPSNGWVTNITSGTDLLAAMRNHISNVAGHYTGKLAYWDVVNEAFEDNGTRRQSVFQQRIGNTYIEEAFRAARAADPQAKLCYNDFNTDGMNAKSNAVFAMVSDFRTRGVPIDCVGFQSHLIVGQVPSDYQANLQRFVNLGIDVNITELDIRMPTPASTQNLQTQAANYRTIVQACLAVGPRCTSITVWGIPDKFSWVPGVFPGQGAALLFDDNYNKKPAYDQVTVALGGTLPTSTPPSTPPSSNPTTSNPPPTGACSATYQVLNQWPGGFTASVDVRAGTAGVSAGWTVRWTFANGQGITQIWSGTVISNPPNVGIRNVSYNSTIPANGTINFGFNGSWTGTNSLPTNVTCTSP